MDSTTILADYAQLMKRSITDSQITFEAAVKADNAYLANVTLQLENQIQDVQRNVDNLNKRLTHLQDQVDTAITDPFGWIGSDIDGLGKLIVKAVTHIPDLAHIFDKPINKDCICFLSDIFSALFLDPCYWCPRLDSFVKPFKTFFYIVIIIILLMCFGQCFIFFLPMFQCCFKFISFTFGNCFKMVKFNIRDRPTIPETLDVHTNPLSRHEDTIILSSAEKKTKKNKLHTDALSTDLENSIEMTTVSHPEFPTLRRLSEISRFTPATKPTLIKPAVKVITVEAIPSALKVEEDISTPPPKRRTLDATMSTRTLYRVTEDFTDAVRKDLGLPPVKRLNFG